MSNFEENGDVIESLLRLGNAPCSSEFVQISTYGLDNPNWLIFLKDFPSADKYKNRVEDFIDFHNDDGEQIRNRNLEDFLSLFWWQMY